MSTSCSDPHTSLSPCSNNIIRLHYNIYIYTSMSNHVSISLAQPSDRALLEGLMQFYLYDLSELEADDSSEMEFTDDGRLPPYRYLPEYWIDASRTPVLIKRGERPVGFALINQISHRDERNVDCCMAEFFVARKHRRHGVATQALHLILAAHPGRWEVSVDACNRGALGFWPRAIASASNITELVRYDCDTEHWSGPIWSFTATARVNTTGE